MNQPLISVIIPTFNRGYLIGETLDSVLTQTYENWECIIVDDGSTDNTLEVIEEYLKKDLRFKYFERPKNIQKGANACRNYGFKISKGEFVNWFDDDDIMLNNFLEKKIELFHPEIDLVICSGTYVTEKLEKLQVIDLILNSYLFKDYALWKLPVLTPSILFRKKYLENKELFSLTISRGQETELFSRLFYRLDTQKFVIINISLFLYRQHVSTVTYKNNEYVKSFKESQMIIAIENFKKSIQLEDFELIRHYYFIIIDFFYRGLEQKHVKICSHIVKKATFQMYKINKSLGLKFCISSYLLILIKRGSYRIEKHFRKAYFS
ncbi:glycosyltransferase family 2 protein [Flavobacterium poyangense]|uniref:glycosyltransferase family 2 protein n=1 Tax=Flavobacterium poyangense TaxID=2204302 RepID=UPI001422C1AC|nr:glycosyltransferase family 2 protein [Flavobacterium sp. JXAS1]